MDNIKSKAANATRWSVPTEITAKIIVPLTNAVLARLLMPEAFGLVATINMIISFSDVLTESGFSQYIIQHDFKAESVYIKCISVAFWSNFIVSSVFFGFVIGFRYKIASLIGCSGNEWAMVIACVAIPITSFSSIPIAILQRKFDYKSLFYNRLAASLTPLVVTTGLALLGFEHWALIIGTLASQIIKASILMYRSKWHPTWDFSIRLLKEMLSYSMWIFFEALAMWACSWIDIFIIGRCMGAHYTGIYKTAQSTVTGILSVVTASVNSILFSSLSRLKNKRNEFANFFYEFQEMLALIVVPMGVGIYCFRDVITRVLLGSKWLECSNFIGYWALAMSLVATMGTFCREALRASAKTKTSFFAQVTNLLIIIPVVNITVKCGFEILTIFRSIAYLEIIIALLICVKVCLRLHPSKVIANTMIPMVCSIIMGAFAVALKAFINNNSVLVSFAEIVLCMLLYFCAICCFSKKRRIIVNMVKSVARKIKGRRSEQC